MLGVQAAPPSGHRREQHTEIVRHLAPKEDTGGEVWIKAVDQRAMEGQEEPVSETTGSAE